MKKGNGKHRTQKGLEANMTGLTKTELRRLLEVRVNREQLEVIQEIVKVREVPPDNFGTVKFVERDVLARWNALARELGLPTANVMSGERRQKLAARLRECGGEDGLEAAFARIRESPGLQGHNTSGWKLDFDAFLSKAKFTRIMEGRYAKWGTNGQGNSLRDAFEDIGTALASREDFGF